METKRAIGYVRVSTEEQAMEGFSLDNQKKDIIKHCEYMSWKLEETFMDEGITGADMVKRYGIKQALNFIKEQKTNYLVVWKLSRLSRRVSDVVDIMRFLKENETYLISIKDNIDTSLPMGEYFVIIASIFAEMERENMIVQVKGGMSERAKQGKWNGGVPPLGYDLIDKELIINEKEAKIIKLIFSSYLQGKGYKAIAEKLNNEGYTTRRAKRFVGSRIKEILMNPTYAGKIRWGYRKDWGKKDSSGKRKRKYNDNPIIVDGKHKAIVSNELFEKVQTLIKTNPRHHVRPFNAYHLLSGLLRCPDCDFGMSIQNVYSKGRQYAYYTCNQYFNYKTCRPNSIRKDLIEEEFFCIVNEIINIYNKDENILRSLNNPEIKISHIEFNIKEKQGEINRLNQDNDKLYKQLLNENREELIGFIKDKIQKNLKSVRTLELNITKDQESISEFKNQNFSISEIVDMLKNISTTIKLLDKKEQQRLIRGLINRITIKDKHITELHFTFGKVLELGNERRTVS